MTIAPSTRPEHDDELCGSKEYGTCFRCHVGTVQLGYPTDSPANRRHGKTPPRLNQYEKGIPTSKRPGGYEMPYLNKVGSPMGQVEFNSKRHLIEENKRRAHNAPAPTLS